MSVFLVCYRAMMLRVLMFVACLTLCSPQLIAAELQWPKSIKYEQREGRHIYTILGIRSGNSENEKDRAHYYKAGLNWYDVKLDLKNNTCSFIAAEPVQILDFRTFLDYSGTVSGELPYWAELEARDLLEAPGPSAMQVTVTPAPKPFPDALAWFVMKSGEGFPLQLPVQFGYGHTGALLITPLTSMCMSHDRFVLRLLDSTGKVMWKDDTIAYGYIKLALVDRDGDLFHEVLIDREDHGEKAQFKLIFRPFTKSEPRDAATDPFEPGKDKN